MQNIDLICVGKLNAKYFAEGVAVVTLKKNQTIVSVVPADTLELANPHRYRVRSLPATGALIRAEDEGEQMSLL